MFSCFFIATIQFLLRVLLATLRDNDVMKYNFQFLSRMKWEISQVVDLEVVCVCQEFHDSFFLLKQRYEASERPKHGEAGRDKKTQLRKTEIQERFKPEKK